MANLEIYNFDHVVSFSVLALTEHNLAIKTADLWHCGLQVFTLSAASPIWPKGTETKKNAVKLLFNSSDFCLFSDC